MPLPLRWLLPSEGVGLLFRRDFLEGVGGDFPCVGTDVDGPRFGFLIKAGGVACKEGASDFFVVRQISCHGGKKQVGAFLGLSDGVALGVGPAGFLDEFSDGNRSSAGLFVQPIPMAGEKRNFACHHAQLGAAGTTGFSGARFCFRGGCRDGRGSGDVFFQSGQHIAYGSAKIDFNGFAAGFIENQNGIWRSTIEGFFNLLGDVKNVSGCNATDSVKSNAKGDLLFIHDFIFPSI